MDEFNDNFFRFSKGERVAILIVVAVIVLLVVVAAFRPFRLSVTPMPFHPLDSLNALHEQAKRDASENQKMAGKAEDEPRLTPFPFNPNDLDEEEWKRMGLTDRQIRNIKNYEAKGGRFFTKNDLKKLYTISDDDFAVLEPFIVLPQTSQANSKRPKEWKTAEKEHEKPIVTKAIPIVPINSADSAALTELPNVNPYLASRVVNYRQRLGNFVSLEQLLEVKGLDTAKLESMSPYVQLNPVEINKLDVNRDEFKTLLRHPYLSYEQVKAIVRHRESKGMLKDWAQLQKVAGTEESLNPLLEYYVKY